MKTNPHDFAVTTDMLSELMANVSRQTILIAPLLSLTCSLENSKNKQFASQNGVIKPARRLIRRKTLMFL